VRKKKKIEEWERLFTNLPQAEQSKLLGVVKSARSAEGVVLIFLGGLSREAKYLLIEMLRTPAIQNPNMEG